MRRVLALAVFTLACLLLPAEGLGHPGHGPATVGVRYHGFRPDPETIGVGDAVLWIWNGNDRNHSVTSDPGQGEQFDSDPLAPPVASTHRPPNDTFTYAFNHVGRFTYHCKVHPDMHGTIVVVELPKQDTTRPRISRVRVRPSRRTAVLRYTLSEKADVIARIQRRVRGRWRTRKALDLSGKRGRNRKRFSIRGMRAGRYRARLIAYDDANNRSNAPAARFRVKRRR